MAVESRDLSDFADEQARAAQSAARPLTPLLRRCGILVREDAKLNFDQSHDPDGVAWAPLAISRARGGDKPLRDRGLLMASMVGRSLGSIESISGNTLEQGTNLEYAGIHQSGGAIVPTGGRKFLAIPRTPEAARAGSPRRFRRPLIAIIGKRGGVLVERTRSRQRAKKRSAFGKLQFALVRRVVIPARPFLGFGARLIEKVERAIVDYFKLGAGGRE